MATIWVTTREGAEVSLQGTNGHSVMEVLRANGVEELLALCGGCCSCATCHVVVDPRDIALLPAVGEDEDALLASSGHRQPTSRLACQIVVGETLDGLRVTVAPED